VIKNDVIQGLYPIKGTNLRNFTRLCRKDSPPEI
jgi:hypothetical protein